MMGKLVTLEGQPVRESLGAIEREQLAAQVVAVMQAHFTRPGPEQMKQVLNSAVDQVTALQQ